MQNELWETLINRIIFLITFFGSLFGLYKGWEVYWKERSAGSEAIKKLSEADEKITREIEELQNDQKVTRDQMAQLGRDYKELISDTLRMFRGGRR